VTIIVQDGNLAGGYGYNGQIQRSCPAKVSSNDGDGPVARRVVDLGVEAPATAIRENADRPGFILILAHRDVGVTITVQVRHEEGVGRGRDWIARLEVEVLLTWTTATGGAAFPQAA
jgi:hypothetical protein